MIASQVISKAYNGRRNLITPNIVGYYEVGHLAVELSSDEFMGKMLWGVSVVNSKTNEPEYDLSMVFFTRYEADYYIQYTLQESANVSN